MIESARAILRIRCSSDMEAEVISEAIRPETRATVRYRSKVSLSRVNEYIMLVFESRDTTSLRAAINSYLSWLIALKSIYNFLVKEGPGGDERQS